MSVNCVETVRESVNQCTAGSGGNYYRYACLAPIQTLQLTTYDSGDCTGSPVSVDVYTQYTQSTNGLDNQCNVQQQTGKSIFYNAYADNRQNITVTSRLSSFKFLQVVRDSLSVGCLDQKNLLYYPLVTGGKTSLPVGSANSYRTYTCEPNSKLTETFCTNTAMSTGCTSNTYDANICLPVNSNTQSQLFICPDLGTTGDARTAAVDSVLMALAVFFALKI